MKPLKFVGLCAFAYLCLLNTFGFNIRHDDPTPATTTNAPVIVYAPVSTAPSTLPRTAEATTTTSVELVPTSQPAPLVGPDTPCQEWIPLAVENGWPADREILETLASVMWRESRCQPEVVSAAGDHGLTQINQIHADYLNILGWTIDDMHDPAKNLYFAWLLYSEREAAGKCGWQPWSLKCS